MNQVSLQNQKPIKLLNTMACKRGKKRKMACGGKLKK